MKNGAFKWVCIALALILVGSIVANIAHTSGGAVKIRSIEYVTEDGILLRALLYLPDSATNTSPAPAIVSSHGYNNTAEVQNMNAVELSKRGYVVMAIDAYGHGRSSIDSVNMDHGGLVPDMGGYAALQYVAALPFVDGSRVGMVGHSMGCGVIQNAAMRAFTANESDPAVAVPAALLLTSNSFATDAEDKELLYAKYPVNVGSVFGQFDEWTEGMWGVKKGSDMNIAPKAVAAMGFSGAEYGAYYNFGEKTALTAEQAIEAAAGKTLRVLYQPPIDHPRVHFSATAERSVLDFFDITLKAGKEPLASTSQTWQWKEFGTGLALLGFFIFLAPFALMLLKTPFFGGIVQTEPVAPTVVDSSAKSKLTYWLIYVLCLLPAPLIFHWAVGYCIDIPNMGRSVDIVLKANRYFQLPCVNGIVVTNLIVGAFLLVVFLLTYQFIMKKNGNTIDNLGVKISVKNFFKALLLAVVVFLSAYALLVLVDYFFMTDFRLWVFSIRPMMPMRWIIFLKYLPFFAFFFIIASLTLNSFTRIRGQKEWINMLLMIGASIIGFAVLTLLDYGALKITGVKMFPYAPYPAGAGFTSAFGGLFAWNMMVALTAGAVNARILFKKTGSIWTGAFVNALLITLFAVSNTVVVQGMF